MAIQGQGGYALAVYPGFHSDLRHKVIINSAQYLDNALHHFMDAISRGIHPGLSILIQELAKSLR